jgi:hypothetical protein
MSLRGGRSPRRHLRRTAFVAVQVSNLPANSGIASPQRTRLAMTKGRKIKLSRINFERGAKRDLHPKTYFIKLTESS